MQNRCETYTLNLKEIAPFIKWYFFFHAWKLTGDYTGIEQLCDCESCCVQWLSKFSLAKRAKAEEALKLMRDAKELMRRLATENAIQIKATLALSDAKSTGNSIEIDHFGKKIILPTLRQQIPSRDGYCLSLSDFISPKHDQIGLFAISVRSSLTFPNDLYMQMLQQTLCDRIVEASSEYMHQVKMGGVGIRPAVGYPCLPDQSLIFELAKMLPLHEVGIQLTENGAMTPHSSVCGMYITHPESRYFVVGKISEEQLAKYAQMRGKSPEEIRKFLINCV